MPAPKTITIKEFTKNFSEEQKQIMDSEIQYHQLLSQFKQAREGQGISQEELAKRAGLNRSTLSRIESGMRNATLETMSRIAHALNLKLSINLH